MSEEQAATGANGESQQPAREVALRKIYVKDFSFESPGAPSIFMQQDFKPSTNLNLSTKNNKIEDNLYECVLTLTLDAKFDNETAFLVELQQAGVFPQASSTGDAVPPETLSKLATGMTVLVSCWD